MKFTEQASALDELANPHDLLKECFWSVSERQSRFFNLCCNRFIEYYLLCSLLILILSNCSFSHIKHLRNLFLWQSCFYKLKCKCFSDCWNNIPNFNLLRKY